MRTPQDTTNFYDTGIPLKGIRREHIAEGTITFTMIGGLILPAQFDPTVYGTGTTTIDPDDAVNHGVSAAVSRTDHQHVYTCAAPISATAGATLAEGTGTNHARDDHQHNIKAAGAEVHLTAVEATATGVAENIAWDAATEWNGEFWDSGNPTRLKCPFAGLYRVVASVEWSANTTDRRRVRIFHSDGTAVGGSIHDGVGVSNTIQNCHSVLKLCAVNDFYEIEVQQVSGGALDLEIATTKASIEFAGVVT